MYFIYRPLTSAKLTATSNKLCGERIKIYQGCSKARPQNSRPTCLTMTVARTVVAIVDHDNLPVYVLLVAAAYIKACYNTHFVRRLLNEYDVLITRGDDAVTGMLLRLSYFNSF